jgi:hypothetical protein
MSEMIEEYENVIINEQQFEKFTQKYLLFLTLSRDCH